MNDYKPKKAPTHADYPESGCVFEDCLAGELDYTHAALKDFLTWFWVCEICGRIFSKTATVVYRPENENRD